MRRTLLCATVVGTSLVACGKFGFDPAGGDDDTSTPLRKWSAAAVTDTNSCGITSGELWCWGAGLSGVLGVGRTPAIAPPVRVGDDADWTAVAVSETHACGLRGDGQLYCWGSNEHGALALGGVDAIVASPVHVAGARWVAIDTGHSDTCGIQVDGSLWCWGRNDAGQLGLGTKEDSPPTRVGAPATWKSISVGAVTTCGVQSDETAWCWGNNDRGQVGDGTSENHRTSLVQVMPGTAWKAIATADFHSCGIDTTGTAWCWGLNIDGRLGTGTLDTVFSPAKLAGPQLVAIALGARHSCATTADDELRCWGASVRGAIADVTARSVTAPMRSDQAARSVMAGGDTTCVLDPDGHLACTGANGFGQAGQPAGLAADFERADDRTDWKTVYARRTHACGQTTGGVVRCWGAGMEGQLGDSAQLDRQQPVDAGAGYGKLALNEVATAALSGTELWGWGIDVVNPAQYTAPHLFETGILDFTLGERHACAIQLTGRIACGGQNFAGQLGDGTTVDNPEVFIDGVWRDLAASAAVTCAVRADGGVAQLHCWGAGDLAGCTTAGNVLAPAAVGPPLDTKQIALGGNFGCALLGGGELWCWGYNDHGQLGVAEPYSQVPVRVGTRADWRAIAAGDTHACAIASDRSLWCWGRADEGQLGAPHATRRPISQVGTDTDWESIALGDRFTCAVKTDGTRWCSGVNSAGELGNGRAWLTSFVAVP